jgi:hypothetical protein
MKGFVSATVAFGLWFGGVLAQEESDGLDLDAPVEDDAGADRTSSGPCVRRESFWEVTNSNFA